ncbi:MAG: ABC transporter ATP-binding protein [Filifactoraceae bacterium]
MTKNRVTILKTEKLCKSFNKKDYNEHILKNIDLEIYENDFTVIMGASGSGKSTLLYMLSGMDTPSLGKVIFKDEIISQKDNNGLSLFRKNHCGFVFQQINLINNLTVLDNVVVCGLLKNNRVSEVVENAKKLLKDVGINEKIYRNSPTQISGGEAQRIAIARAEINQPDIIFADEPTGALNSNSGNMVLELLSKIYLQGRTILMVTHDFNAALRGNRVIYLKDGIICGECNLGRFDLENNSERYKSLENFLKKMGW